jgi:hypothetical protein
MPNGTPIAAAHDYERFDDETGNTADRQRQHPLDQ